MRFFRSIRWRLQLWYGMLLAALKYRLPMYYLETVGYRVRESMAAPRTSTSGPTSVPPTAGAISDARNFTEVTVPAHDPVPGRSPAHRQGASWVMNASTLAKVRKMKDGQGQFLWAPALSADMPATLLGYPVIETEAMPDVGVDSLSIAFGNFKAGYLIAERSNTAVLRDPYSNKPFVHFYATRRVGGAVVNSEAIKLMKFAVS